MLDKVDDGIVVLASDPSDRRLMDELLVESGLRGPALESGGGAGGGGPSTPRATIVCHRATLNAPRPTLPETGSGRLLVFSDCRSEGAVVEALEGGAHHYFDIDESRPVLRARLAAALRAWSRQLQRGLSVPPFRFDSVKRRAWRANRPIGLSPKEFDLAFYLFFHRGRTVGNGELMTAVWSLPRTMDTRRIDTAACRIRKKMGLEGADASWRLDRLRGIGYLLVPARAAATAGARAETEVASA